MNRALGSVVIPHVGIRRDLDNRSLERSRNGTIGRSQSVIIGPVVLRFRAVGIMKIIDKYLWREMGGYFLPVIFGFVVLMVGNTLYLMSEQIFSKHIPFTIVTQIILLRIPAMLVLGFPVATLLTIQLALGRMGRDSEIVAMRTSGIAMTRIVTPILLFSVVMCVITFWLNERVVPTANHISQNYIRQFWLADAMERARANIFFHVSNDVVIYTEAYDEQSKQMGRLLFFELDPLGYPSLSVVRTGRFEGDNLLLKDGITYEFDRQGEAKQSAKFNLIIKDISRQMQEMWGTSRTPQEMTGSQLRETIKSFRESNVKPFSLETDYYFKFSIPVANFVLAMAAMLFGVVNPRKESAPGVIFAIVCLAVYWIAMTILRSLGQDGRIEPMLAAWGANLLFFLLGLPLLFFVKR
jgi:lipopolysaccharide export system permease protein